MVTDSNGIHFVVYLFIVKWNVFLIIVLYIFLYDVLFMPLAVFSNSSVSFRACSHEPGTVNFPWVMIAPGQASPCVHMMICCPGATLPWVNFIAPGQVQRHLITTNLSEFL